MKSSKKNVVWFEVLLYLSLTLDALPRSRFRIAAQVAISPRADDSGSGALILLLVSISFISPPKKRKGIWPTLGC